MRTSVLDRAKERFGSPAAGVYAAVLAIIVLGTSGLAGLLLHQPWLFPSLGPTVMLFFESPEQVSARPANTLVGHGIGLAAGVVCLYALGLQGQPSAPVGGLTPLFVLSGALSVGLTTLALTWLRMPHPPAGATTLIVSLGILSTPIQLASIAAAVVLVAAVGWGLNVLLGTRLAAKA